MTAEDRASEMMKTKMNKLPELAYEYARYLGRIYGMCGEIFYTAWCHYAQAIEHLPCKDKSNLIDTRGTEWFWSNK